MENVRRERGKGVMGYSPLLRGVPVNHHPDGTGLFAMLNDEDDRLMEDSAELFVRDEDATLFDVRYLVRPAMFVEDGLRL